MQTDKVQTKVIKIKADFYLLSRALRCERVGWGWRILVALAAMRHACSRHGRN